MSGRKGWNGGTEDGETDSVSTERLEGLEGSLGRADGGRGYGAQRFTPQQRAVQRDPDSIYALAWRFVEKFGFSAAMCAAMMAFIFWLMGDFKKSVDGMTAAQVQTAAALDRLADAQNVSNDHVAQLTQRLDEHLAATRPR